MKQLVIIGKKTGHKGKPAPSILGGDGEITTRDDSKMDT